MAILETAPGGSWDKDGASRRSALGGLVLRVAKWMTATVIASAAGLFVGFIVFIYMLDRTEPTSIRRGDGIVALTGGVDRIGDAVKWLGAGSGRKLLISGVSHDVTRERLAAKEPGLRRWLNCCVDIGYVARNTVGNAKEIRHWADANGFRSLVVVTSSYHMPRALVELRRQVPEADLIPASVVTSKLEGMDFWRHPDLVRTIGVEYLKFLVAYARAGLTPARAIGDVSDTANRRRA
jgi:uncharacterized SAM-binding protein YcdF (DUF218 family)